MWKFLKELWYLIRHKHELEAMAYLRYGHPTYTLEWFEGLPDYLIYKIAFRYEKDIAKTRLNQAGQFRVFFSIYIPSYPNTSDQLKKIIREELILNELNR